ncbi:helicase sen1-like isoform X2 [Chrysoperla carnea]|uniref:helicase sen1-like isoform X2 n=1 Tax=Chrysoperla carnea TaxID=189513 RepID=UPI001D08E16B|nr:helicase sen1-like isoform X2 [Chrysoperla carnea]
MMLELWSLIQDEYNMNDSLKRVFQVDIKNLHVTSEQMQKNQKMFNLECQLLLTKQDDQNMIHPKIGDALILKLTTENKNGIQESTNRFGYVTSIHKQSIHQTRDELPLHLMMLVNNPQVLVTFMVLTKWDPNKLVTENCIPVRRLGRIIGVMKEFTALQKLPQSPLMPLILNPNNLNKIKNHYNVEILSNSALNVDQREIIFQVTGSCLSSDPTISLIHGPPGTGKSFLIVNLVMHLLYGNNRYNNCVENRNNLPRILICAPTNSAIDDIVLKLLNVRKKIAKPQITFRMVRVGQRNKMHPSVQSISLQTLKEYNSNLGMFKESDGFNKALNNKQNSQMNNIKNDALFQQNKPRKVIDEDIIIKKADIICTTLGSSYSAQLERLAKTKSFRFTTCIIDEATQCTEPTALLPLMLGIDSLVLVGDTKQLPATIKSQEAKKYGLGQSLFERIEKCFSMNKIDNCPNIRSLSVQYRMHPEIMEFPNKYFYGNRLKNSQNVYDYRFPLIPYQLFLHEFEQCSSMDNSREAEFILNMLKTILNEVNNKVTIGIITPYQNQRTRIMKILENIERKEDIVVNTVDGFQGQEKDIIILSCVRTEGFGFLADDQRLNVALTRAKHAFYIVGNFQALQMNPTWRALKDDAEHRKKIFYTKNVMISQDVFSKILKDKNFVK